MKRLNIYSPNAISEAVKFLESGQLVIYPTDTLYGLGADAKNSLAVEKISQIKGRLGPWSIATSDFTMLNKFCVIPKSHSEFVKEKLPGPVTIILPGKSQNLAPALLGPNKSVGVRIPDHLLTQKLIKRLGRPITSTSVNRTGKFPLNDPNKIIKTFFNEVDLILDAGILPTSLGSSIYNLSSDEIKKIR
ncbi:MAG: threonylcarbamoyl-AMP synthase [Candidatus Marinimicrobia bacterium]|nr:threonylcarbamoyl-AMP synthase [Candidatus Neomarinimicrobiota bacterium]|tara:strand:+ start:7119 stop:7688 length:570 start_codon:yes stop_codon:yes gene_type:complete